MRRGIAMLVAAAAIALCARFHGVWANDTAPLLTGINAFGDWRDDAPGVRRKITVADLPPPFATESAGNDPLIVQRPSGAELKVPPEFVVQEFASGLDHPREIRTAPNGDLFISESYKGRIRVLRAPDGAAKPQREEIFASGLTLPFGIAFWPPGPDPQFVYVADTDSVVRYPYRSGDLIARGPAETTFRVFQRAGVFAAAATGRATLSSPWTVRGCLSRSGPAPTTRKCLTRAMSLKFNMSNGIR